jgi:hypothetical protein
MSAASYLGSRDDNTSLSSSRSVGAFVEKSLGCAVALRLVRPAVRCVPGIAEHFTIGDGLIRRIRHVHDTAALRPA